MKSAVAIVLTAALTSGATVSVATVAQGVTHASSVGHAWVGSSGGSGGDGTSWTDPDNWSPAGVPGPRDTAEVFATGATCQATVEGIPPDTTVARLVVSQQNGCVASVGGGSLTIAKAFAWVSGVIATDVTIPAGSHAAFAAAADRDLAGTLTLAGTMTLERATLTVEQPDGLTVVANGHLQGSGAITGSVVNTGGTVSAGTSEDDGPNLSVSGDYTQLAAGTLQFHLPGAFTALRVGGQATIRGRVVYHTTHTYPRPPYGTRQLVITADDLAWNPSCRTSTGPYHKVGYWFSIPGRGGIPDGWFVKIKFKEGASHVC